VTGDAGKTGPTGPPGGATGPTGSTGADGFSHVYGVEADALPAVLDAGRASAPFRVIANAQVFSTNAADSIACTLQIDSNPVDSTTVDTVNGFSEVVLEGAGTTAASVPHGFVTLTCTPSGPGSVTVNSIKIQAIEGMP